MAWSTSNRRAQLPVDWHKRRARAWRNAAGQCEWIDNGQRCEWTGRLNGDGGQADHIDRHGSDEPANLQWLCPPHHKTKTSAESATARSLSRSRGSRQPEQHPGLL